MAEWFSVGDLEPCFPGSIQSCGAMVMVECPWARQIFENIVTKGEIAQNEQFHLLSQCFKLVLIILLSFLDIFQISA